MFSCAHFCVSLLIKMKNIQFAVFACVKIGTCAQTAKHSFNTCTRAAIIHNSFFNNGNIRHDGGLLYNFPAESRPHICHCAGAVSSFCAYTHTRAGEAKDSISKSNGANGETAFSYTHTLREGAFNQRQRRQIKERNNKKWQ